MDCSFKSGLGQPLINCSYGAMQKQASVLQMWRSGHLPFKDRASAPLFPSASLLIGPRSRPGSRWKTWQPNQQVLRARPTASNLQSCFRLFSFCLKLNFQRLPFRCAAPLLSRLTARVARAFTDSLKTQLLCKKTVPGFLLCRLSSFGRL